jgi:superfamily II RNA helicase
MIFDEIHNVYNKEDKNTWGITIQLISKILGTSIHMLFMSATPLNNPEEITELLTLMDTPPMPTESSKLK